MRPGYENAYRVCYRSQHLIVVVEGLSFGFRTRLCLIEPEGRYLDLTELVGRRDPELLDWCHLANRQREQIPLFAEALRKCAPDVLSGDLSAISPLPDENVPGFSFSAFLSQVDRDYILALHGPRDHRETLSARNRRAALLLETKARLGTR